MIALCDVMHDDTTICALVCTTCSTMDDTGVGRRRLFAAVGRRRRRHRFLPVVMSLQLVDDRADLILSQKARPCIERVQARDDVTQHRYHNKTHTPTLAASF